jgi:hypothetical protein
LEAPALLPSFFWLPQLAVQFYEAQFLNCALPSGKKKCNDQENQFEAVVPSVDEELIAFCKMTPSVRSLGG